MGEQVTSNRSPIPILTYHQIASKPPKGTPYRSLVVSPEDFERHMAFLKALGYRGLSMSHLLPYLRGNAVGKVFGITFDDGYLNNLENALPVLQRLGFSSTCYVVSDLIGKENSWDISVGIPQVPLMSMAQLRQWVQGGQEVGAHTKSHAKLTDITIAECEREVSDCKWLLEQSLGCQINHFCYPYGQFGTVQVDLVKGAGYQTSTTTIPKRVTAGQSFWQLTRVSVVRRTTRLGLAMKMITGLREST